ncbi:hypothetical protein KM043_011529 [Ampulex compressa]|nr:hypothetical protein KM043_011529 [Ampulex compressa]
MVGPRPSPGEPGSAPGNSEIDKICQVELAFLCSLVRWKQYGKVSVHVINVILPERYRAFDVRVRHPGLWMEAIICRNMEIFKADGWD